jgi:hypothetical protein
MFQEQRLSRQRQPHWLTETGPSIKYVIKENAGEISLKVKKCRESACKISLSAEEVRA